MKFFQIIKGDIYAGFRVPGIATGVKNLAYLCVKLQAEISGDEQILKYNGIGGLQNTTPIPSKTYINSLVEKFKTSIGTITADIPDASTIAHYDSRYQRTRGMLNEILAKYLHPQSLEDEEHDTPDSAPGFQPFDDQTSTSSDSNDDDDQSPKRGLKRIRGRTESTTSDHDQGKIRSKHTPIKRRRLTKSRSKSSPQESLKSADQDTMSEPVAGPSHLDDESTLKQLSTITESEIQDPVIILHSPPGSVETEAASDLAPTATIKISKVRRAKK
jgi:hypothetical protein